MNCKGTGVSGCVVCQEARELGEWLALSATVKYAILSRIQIYYGGVGSQGIPHHTDRVAVDIWALSNNTQGASYC